MWNNCEIKELIGKTIIETSGSKGDESITFKCETGEEYEMSHDQDCCESVSIEDIAGDINWLIESPILVAEERTSDENPIIESEDSFTWTFYELATLKGAVTIRWYGVSNGYYSERVDFKKWSIKNVE